MSFKGEKDLFVYITAGRLLIFLLLFAGAYLVPDFFLTSKANYLSWLLGCAFLLTIIWITWFRKVGLTERLKHFQIISDVLLVTFAIWLTGGIKSNLTFLYSIAIITACLLSPEKNGGLSALLSVLFYALCSILTFHGQVPLNKAFFTFFINMGAFGIIALLAIHLSKRLKAAEEKLIETAQDIQLLEEIQKHLANSMKSGLITLDLDGNILYYNIAALGILGDIIKSSYGKNIYKILPQLDGLLNDCSSNKESRRHEIVLKQNGKEIVLGISCFLIEDQFSGKLLGKGMIFQDITEIKAQEEKLRLIDRLAALGEMAAGLAHEIRNPLASISGAAEFLEQSDLTLPEGKKLLKIIQREVERLTKLTSSFLLYGRPEKKELKEINIKNEIQSVLELIRRRKDKKNLKIELKADDKLSLLMEPDMFRQVLLNCLLNSIEAVPENEGRVEIHCKNTDGKLFIAIKDNGCGIDEKEITRVFDPFFTTKPNGTGLGLSIVHRIVTELGGTIHISSQKNKGTTCEFIFPNPISN